MGGAELLVVLHELLELVGLDRLRVISFLFFVVWAVALSILLGHANFLIFKLGDVQASNACTINSSV